MLRDLEWQPVMSLEESGRVRIVNPNEIAVLTADGYEQRAVDLFNRGYVERAQVCALLAIAARLERD